MVSFIRRWIMLIVLASCFLGVAGGLANAQDKAPPQKTKVRVLIFAGGPVRDYQFLRALLEREAKEKRAELTVLLQTAPGKARLEDGVKILASFPDRVGRDLPNQKGTSLNNYDVVVAFDPDWSKLSIKQLENLKEWVATHAGGVLFVGGRVNSYRLARPGGLDLSAVLALLPVVLKDHRLVDIDGADTSRPYYLRFNPKVKITPFLKLEEWDRFFGGDAKKTEPGGVPQPKRGIYTYYPVERLRPAADVIASFAGPKASRIDDGMREQPYLVTMNYGSGRTMYLGSAETWRLRRVNESYHDRFWVALLNHLNGAPAEKKGKAPADAPRPR